MSYCTEFDRVQQDVLSMLPDLSVLLEATLNCTNRNVYSTNCGTKGLGTFRMRAIRTCGMIDFYSNEPLLGKSKSLEICTNCVSADADIEITKLLSSMQLEVTLYSDNIFSVPFSEFYDIDKSKYFNLLVQYPISEINLKYLIGYAILIKYGSIQIPNSIGVFPSNIELIGRLNVVQALKEYNENKNSKNIQS